jgi:hypothetical protein
MGKNKSTKAGEGRSHAGRMIVGIALVGGAVTYAYKREIPEPPKPGLEQQNAAAPAPGFDLDNSIPLELAPAPVRSPMPEATHEVSPAITSYNRVDASRRSGPVPSSWAPTPFPPTYSMVVPLADASGAAREVGSDVLELGQSYEIRDEQVSTSKPSESEEALASAALAAPSAEIASASSELAKHQDELGAAVFADERLDGPDTRGVAFAADALSAGPVDKLAPSLDGPAGPETAGLADDVTDNTALIANRTNSSVDVTDVGIAIPASAETVVARTVQTPWSSAEPSGSQVTPTRAQDNAAGFEQHYLPTYWSSREVGSVPMRLTTNHEVLVHLGSFLGLFRDAMEPSLYDRLRLSPNADAYVSLETVRRAGVDLRFDSKRERFVVSGH